MPGCRQASTRRGVVVRTMVLLALVGGMTGVRAADATPPEPPPSAATVQGVQGVPKPALPSAVLDLRPWKLTLPLADHRGRAQEVTQPALLEFQHPTHFFVLPDGTGVAFQAPCHGATTKNSSYPRSELREMSADGRVPAAWSTTDAADRQLDLRLAFTRLPTKKPHAVAAQIHDAEDDLLMIRLERTKLMVERGGHDDLILEAQYRLGTPVDLRITAGKGRVRVHYQGVERLDWPVRADGCYFKAGCYTQSNAGKGEPPDSAASVVLYRLALTVPTRD